MESHPLLSNNQFLYITSQKDKLTKEFNKSQDLSRLETKVKKCFEAFELIWNSDELSQKYKDKLFSDAQIGKFIGILTSYNHTNPVSSEVNKQRIAREMIHYGFAYFQRRYKTTQFLSNEIGK